MLGTVTVGPFYRQLVSRVRTTAGQESRGLGRLQTGSSRAHVRMLSDDPVDLRGHTEVGRLGADVRVQQVRATRGLRPLVSLEIPRGRRFLNF